MESGLPRPDKRSCATCGQSETADKALRRCGKCRIAPYCSAECQKSDWKEHKKVCHEYIQDSHLRSNSLYADKKGPKVPKGEVKRTRKDILNDLLTYTESHSKGDINIAVWTLMGLTRDISKANTHFVAMTLRRTKSSNPRSMYWLLGAEVLPLQALKDAFAKRSNLFEGPTDPVMMHEKDVRENLAKGGLGSALVMSTELPPGDDRPPHEAIKDMAVYMCQPLGLYEHSKAIMLQFEAQAQMIPMSYEYHLKCIGNMLSGGHYAVEFEPDNRLLFGRSLEPPAGEWTRAK